MAVFISSRPAYSIKCSVKRTCCRAIQRELEMHSTVPCKHFNFSWIFLLFCIWGGEWLLCLNTVHHFPDEFRSPVIYCSEIVLTQFSKNCILRWIPDMIGQAVGYVRTGRTTSLPATWHHCMRQSCGKSKEVRRHMGEIFICLYTIYTPKNTFQNNYLPVGVYEKILEAVVNKMCLQMQCLIIFCWILNLKWMFCTWLSFTIPCKS